MTPLNRPLYIGHPSPNTVTNLLLTEDEDERYLRLDRENRKVQTGETEVKEGSKKRRVRVRQKYVSNRRRTSPAESLNWSEGRGDQTTVNLC